ncbi:L,D-transpeptidase family protein [Litchfieldia salsa]|uniref:Lipoprotein-anchoring transpeptidase ErfK/SrfK n=1 Tax=Litchfieldia salsa TaxID=930152 RepID=A0A1H0UBI8_9BACI|nr:Lipoprotein-anchoring transpeptidase ErfK/SrfK [Litchfieldia salsa]
MMEYAVEQSVEKAFLTQKKPVKWYKNWKLITLIFIIVIGLILAATTIYQATHFNQNIKINEIDMSGLTANQALKKLQTTVLNNEIYIGKQQIINGKDTKMGYTEGDLPGIKTLLKKQWTFFPSFKTKNYALLPVEQDIYRNNILKNRLEQKLVSMNQDLKAPTDAQVTLKDGRIIVSNSIKGEQFDVTALIKEYEQHDYTSEIHLNSIYLEPIKEDSEMIIAQKEQFQEFLNHTVEYKVQDQIHSLKAGDLIKNASLLENMEVSIDPNVNDIVKKITEINDSQSTLSKDFKFKTHSGKEISVKGQGYGWALDVNKEAAMIKAAFEKGEKSISASHIYGNGWSNEGYGYDTIINNGIGDTYAEVSIAEQRIWIFKNGKLVVTTNVVTGKHSTGENTLPGVWYILYKRAPYTLNGSSAGNPNYSIEVDYWAPFTNSGQGFHDASWRTNWASNAYQNAGSGGCVNVPPHVMKSVYDHLNTYDPVVIY